MNKLSAALRAWDTRRKNEMVLAEKRSKVALKACLSRKINSFKGMGLSDWHAAEVAGALEKKAPHRKRIERFILENHPAGELLHLLSFPGSRWELERSIHKARPSSMFTGIERDKRFIGIARETIDACAPGGKMIDGSLGGYKYLTNDTSWLLNLAAGDAADAWLRIHGSGVSAIWADFMGKIDSADFGAFIAGLPKILAPGPIPAVFTVYKGREGFFKDIVGSYDANTVRVNKLTEMLANAGLSFKLSEAWAYKSDIKGSGEMLNIAGILETTGEEQTRGQALGRPRRSEQPRDAKAFKVALCKLLNHYGSQRATARAIGINEVTIRFYFGGNRAPHPVNYKRIMAAAAKLA